MKKYIALWMGIMLLAGGMSACGNGDRQQNDIVHQNSSASDRVDKGSETEHAESERDIGTRKDDQAMFEERAVDYEKAEQIGSVTAGTEYYEDFLIDNRLTFQDDTETLHYHIYIPDSYDGSKPYALYITLPGYGAYYFQGVAVNLRMEHFAIEAKAYNEAMIIVAPQPNDWGETSKRQTIKLTEYMLAAYNIDPDMVYISGYSGGGETLSLAVSERPELYTAALHVSSKWDGNLSEVAKSGTPVYFAIGEVDEYYGSEPVKEAYEALTALYEQDGLTQDEINALVVLDIKEQGYFVERGMWNQHGGGGLFAEDEEIMGWLFAQ